MRRFICVSIVTLCAVVPSWAATTAVITNDTYIDSYLDPNYPVASDDADCNYGHFGAVKAVTNDGTGADFPDAHSLVHGLFTLPGGSLLDLQTGVSSAVVNYQYRNNMPNGRGVEVHPLLQSFVAGSGGDYTQSKAGPANNTTAGALYDPTAPADQRGASWNTYDGVNAWSTPGAPYDAASVTGVVSGSGYNFDITSLLNNPTTRNEVLTNGLVMIMDPETPYSGNDFVSFYSYEYGVAKGSVYYPTLTYTVPEPTALFSIAIVGLVVHHRRRRS